jgi:hypothetical protein
MPTFCRHNHLIQNCPICSREQNVELRPIVSPSGPKATQSRPDGGAAGARAPRTATRTGKSASGMTVRRMQRGIEDGFRSELVPGLKSSADAEKLADELAFAGTRLLLLAADPPGLYAEVADPGSGLEERCWLAFLIAWLGPQDGDHAFAEIERVRTTWASGQDPEVADLEPGPRGLRDRAQAGRTPSAYRAWAARAGSQAVAFTGDVAWTPERRFARVFERMALPGLDRGARFDLLTTLGRLGVFDLRAASLFLVGGDDVTIAAKRLLGIGDPLLLDRRAAALAEACELPLEALDVGLYNWGLGERAGLGMPPSLEPDPGLAAAARDALGL